MEDDGRPLHTLADRMGIGPDPLKKFAVLLAEDDPGSAALCHSDSAPVRKLCGIRRERLNHTLQENGISEIERTTCAVFADLFVRFHIRVRIQASKGEQLKAVAKRGTRSNCIETLHLDINRFDIMMTNMRTTLTLEPDVEQLLRQEMQRTGSGMKAVVNSALRLGLGMRGKPLRPPRYRVEPHAFGFKPGVDMDRLNQLVDEFEAEEFANRYDR